MKLIYILAILLASLLLTSCEKNQNDISDNNTNISFDEQNDQISGENQKTERLSYSDYIAKYGNVESEDNDSPAINDNEQNNLEETPEFDVIETSPNQLATYSTPLLASSDERVNNLEIVCEKLNNYILYPNESFSYNDAVGPYGPSDGFEEAPILLSDGTKTEGYGGGVCQLSSTLYNVVKNIDNVDITERHHHSAPVSYVPEGQDATISLQSGLDFRFTNNNNFPIRFEAKCENDSVVVSAYKEA